jgi:hypothetical protein
MERISMLIAPAIFSLFASASVIAAEPPVMVNVSHLPPNVAEDVQRAAAQGMTALKRYLEATRKQNALALEDVTRPMDARAPDDITPPRKDYKQHAVDWKPAK